MNKKLRKASSNASIEQFATNCPGCDCSWNPCNCFFLFWELVPRVLPDYLKGGYQASNLVGERSDQYGGIGVSSIDL
jgi:hypothetical protein